MQTSNPFEAPQTQSTPERGRADITPGVIDVKLAFEEAWDSVKSQFGTWLLASFAMGVVAMLLMVTIIGLIGLPTLVWGYVRFTLNALDGQAEVGDVFAGFSEFGETLSSMGIVLLLLGIIGMPPTIIQVVGAVLTESGSDVAGAMVSGVGNLFGFVWAYLVMCRIYYAPFLVVDQGIVGVDAIRQSWDMTADQKLNSALVYIVGGVIVVLGILFLLVGMIPATFVFYGAVASAYRQISGTYGQAADAVGPLNNW